MLLLSLLLMWLPTLQTISAAPPFPPQAVSSTSKPATPHPLQPRFPPHELRLLRIFSSDLIVPVSVAARELELFYWALLHNAVYVWPDTPPLPNLVLSLGHLQIAFFGGGLVQWDFVADFAARMLVVTQLGYTGTYRMTWANRAFTAGVSVMLSITS